MKLSVITTVFVATMASFGQNLVQTSQIRVPSRLANPISIKEFGAKGNGLADDTAAIQSAFNAVCGDTFPIASTSGAGVSPIVITTKTPHTFMNRSVLTISDVGGNTNANGNWSGTVLSPNTVALYSEAGQPTTGNAAYTSGGTISAYLISHLYFPAGTYNISSPLITHCAMSISATAPRRASFFKPTNTG